MIRLGRSLGLFPVLLASSVAWCQTAGLQGRVFDESGATVPNATVTLTNVHGRSITTTSSADSSYSLKGLVPGDYVVRGAAPGLAQNSISIVLKSGIETLRLELKVAMTQQQLTVRENSGPSLSTESANNASALVMRGKDVDALADDPEDLAADLQALAGPAAGPGGSAIYIDGFTGGQLPPKDAIREIRINQNPFSPEYDKLGCGRIEILTSRERTSSTEPAITILAIASGIPETPMRRRRLHSC